MRRQPTMVSPLASAAAAAGRRVLPVRSVAEACPHSRLRDFFLQASESELFSYVYLGPPVGALRTVVLEGLELQPLDLLKDALSTFGIARKGAQEPNALAQRLLDNAKHALLATPDAARRHGLAVPTAEEEEAALQALLAVATGEEDSSDGNVFALDVGLNDGQMLLVMASTVRALMTRIEAWLGRRFVPPGFSWDEPAAPAPAEAQQSQQDEMQGQIRGFIHSVLQHAAAREGRQLSQLPAQAQLDLFKLAGRLIEQRMRSGETSAVPTRPGHFGIMMQATQDDIAELCAAIRALQLPPAPDVPRCAACGMAGDPPLRKLRRCAGCRQARGWGSGVESTSRSWYFSALVAALEPGQRLHACTHPPNHPPSHKSAPHPPPPAARCCIAARPASALTGGSTRMPARRHAAAAAEAAQIVPWAFLGCFCTLCSSFASLCSFVCMLGVLPAPLRHSIAYCSCEADIACCTVRAQRQSGELRKIVELQNVCWLAHWVGCRRPCAVSDPCQAEPGQPCALLATHALSTYMCSKLTGSLA